jgi:hypothetical protein
MNLVKPKVAAKRELLFNKPASGLRQGETKLIAITVMNLVTSYAEFYADH